MNLSQRDNAHFIGVMLVILSAFVFSLAGVYTKTVNAGSWEIIFWRGIFSIVFIAIYAIWRGTFKVEFLQMKASGLAVAIIGASASVAFISAFKMTSMANVALIYAAAPLMAAILAWVWIRESISIKLIAGSVASFIGVAIIVQGSFGTANLSGDMLAVWMTIAFATVMVIYRCYPETPTGGPTALSSLLLLPVAIVFVRPFNVPLDEIAIIATFALTFSIAAIALAEGAKRIPAGEAALLSVLETPLVFILGWLFFAEIPPLASFIGGALILVAIVATQVSTSR